MKKLLSLAMATLMILGVLSGCGGGSSDSDGGGSSGSSDKPIELNMNVTPSETSVWMVAAETFKEMVEEGTEGRYQVNIYPNEQLSSGDMVKGCEMLFTGVTDLDLHSVINMTGFEEKLTVVTMPWLFTNGYDSVDEILFEGEGGQVLMDLVASKGAVPLALGENGFRQITNNVRPISSPEDMKGLKIRTPAINMYVELFKSLGADPTSMNFSEVFTALQQGTIDGQENPYDTIRSGKIQEVQKYMTIWNYSYDPIVLSASSKLWDSLSDEDKAVFQEAAEVACAKEVEESRKMDSEIVQEFKDSGMEVTELTAEQVAAFQEAVAPIYEQYRDVIGEDVFAAFGYTFD